MNLKENLSKTNSFSFMQYIGAILVVVSHAYPISMGNEAVNPLYRLTSGQLSFGEIAVNLFFFVSGLFIVKSVMNASSFKSYILKRIKRIFPFLIIVMFLTTYVFGFIFTSIDKLNYLFSWGTLKFFISNSLLIPCHYLPGVFNNTVYTGALNGALWTLAPQFLCYVLCYLAFKLHLLDKNKFIFSLPIVCILWFNIEKVFPLSPLIYNMLHPMIFFYMGCLFSIYSEKISLSFKWFLVSVILSAISLCFGFYKYISIFTYSYILIYLAYTVKGMQGLEFFFKKYFYLYYLWGFFIQRMVAYLFGGMMNVYLNIIVSLIIIHIISFITFRIKEILTKRLSYKKLIV